MHYQHHLEAVYIIEGHGEIENRENGEKHALEPFTIYALDQHDLHTLRAGPQGLRCVCVFNPPVTGREVHDASGAYPLVD
jgi:L-ectoine synthase